MFDHMEQIRNYNPNCGMPTQLIPSLLRLPYFSGGSAYRPKLHCVVMDSRTPKKRSEIMSLVKGKNTSAEMAVRRMIFALGYRYRLHGKNLPGRPDVVFPARRKLLFVHGCFWHGHKCPKGRPPKSRLDYWIPKIEQNRKRDRRQSNQLRRSGWKVLVVWQCELKAKARFVRKIVRFLGRRAPRKHRIRDRSK